MSSSPPPTATSAFTQESTAVATPAALLSDGELRRAVVELVPEVDLETTGLKKFIKLLAGKLHAGSGKGVSGAGGGKADEDYNIILGHLKSKSDFIKSVLTEAIEDLQRRSEEVNGEDEGDDDHDSDNDDDDNSDESDDPPTKGTKPRSRAAGGGGGGGGLAEPKPISDELATFLGLERGALVARKDIVKQLWAYIRENDLQNPINKREILLDQPMKLVFGCESFTMFTMNKYIGAHVHPFKPVDLTSNSSPSAKSTPSRKGTPKRRAAAAASKTTRAGRSGSAKKPRKAGTQPPYRLSEELQEVVQVDVLPRPQVVSKLWEYIKANQLQNPSDKREILCDDKLKRIFQNKSKVTMFSMNQFLSHHLLEKVDRTEYTAAAADDDDDEDDDSD